MAALSDQEIEDGLAKLEAWTRAGDAIRREYKFDDFSGSAVTAIDHELWLSTVSGNVTILRR